MKPNLYLIHGWGMNQAVWQIIEKELKQDFNLFPIDIPGYGNHTGCFPDNYSLENISDQICQNIEQPGIILGWSLGGLIAQYIAINYPSKCLALVTVASTSHFQQAEEWPGIKPQVLSTFQQQLSQDYSKTLDRFLAIQMMGSETAKQDIKTLKQLLSRYPMPSTHVLSQGLKLLETVNLNAQISKIQQPSLRLYGRLDSLVPIKAVTKIEKLAPKSQSYIFAKASHAPFISHSKEFIEQLVLFKAAIFNDLHSTEVS